MLPILLLEIFYKMLWLILVAYPLWSKGELKGSPAEGIFIVFAPVILVIFIIPWGYVFRTYVYQSKPKAVVVP
jgi:membrane protein YdbS with pleckstrin-like domain